MAGGPKVYLDYNQQELNDQYNQRILVPDAEKYIAADKAESTRVRRTYNCQLDVVYGSV